VPQPSAPIQARHGFLRQCNSRKSVWSCMLWPSISIIYHLMHMHILHMLEVSPASCSRHGSLIVPHGQLVRLADLHEQTTHNSEQVRRLLSSQCRFSPTVMSRRAREGQTIGLQKKRNTSQWGRCGGHGHHELKQSGENPGH